MSMLFVFRHLAVLLRWPGHLMEDLGFRKL